MVPSKLLRHIETNHREQMNNPISYFENIRSSFQKQSKKFKKFMTTSDEAQTASYMIAQLIARKKKAHAEAEEIILPALKIVAGCMLTNDAMEKVTKIPLSSKTIARRIEDMSEDIELQIKQSFNDSSTKWAIQLDETTDISNKAQLLAFLSILANSGYDPANIYNADETGLFFQLIPDLTLAHKDENCRGVKRMKQRITVLLCCNSTGTDKRRLLIIGKSAKPRCLRNFSPHFYCTYTSNSKAWMTSSIFQEWLLQFSKQLVSEGRRILLLLDNATSHCVPNDGLSNIKIHFLPPNMTASLQPLDSGIIKSFKAQYRKLQLQKMVELADAHLPTELCLDYAVRYCKMAWNSVSPDSISNCWNHTGIIRFTSTAAVESLNYGNLLDHDIFAITPENLMTEREFQLVDVSQEAKMKLTDDNFLVSTVTAKEELGEDDDATVTQRLPSLREARAAAETVLLFLDHSKRATSDDVNLSADFLRRAYAITTNSRCTQGLREQKTSPGNEDPGKAIKTKTIMSGDVVSGLPESTLEESPVIQKSEECRQQDFIQTGCVVEKNERIASNNDCGTNVLNQIKRTEGECPLGDIQCGNSTPGIISEIPQENNNDLGELQCDDVAGFCDSARLSGTTAAIQLEGTELGAPWKCDKARWSKHPEVGAGDPIERNRALDALWKSDDNVCDAEVARNVSALSSAIQAENMCQECVSIIFVPSPDKTTTGSDTSRRFKKFTALCGIGMKRPRSGGFGKRELLKQENGKPKEERNFPDHLWDFNMDICVLGGHDIDSVDQVSESTVKNGDLQPRHGRKQRKRITKALNPLEMYIAATVFKRKNPNI
ncbi:hypothetical protein LAZ67_16002085 [Cordylochernes scorpioides]|uniref:DDE-1 domain-containing protein n=1 Tax=Cordylochernes scorpioides TaxID=51811 RepID=A0ABY6LDT5_9ARAC|nr:hypothetical protein LAZ67_16002085 [Cordylochernes scorpioides]